MAIRFDLFIFSLAVLFAPCLSDLVISSVDRRIDLTSQVVRISSTLKVENVGTDPVSEVLLPLLDYQSESLTLVEATTSEGKGKTKVSSASLPIEVVSPAGLPPSLNLTWYSVSLPKQLGKGERLTLDVRAVFTHIVMPLPETISQDKNQLIVFQDTAFYLSPYAVKAQSLSVKLPADTKLERYTKLEDTTKISGSEIKYGPYVNIPSLSFKPILVHFVNNQPFAVAEELIREIEVSHWGNVKVTEHYNLVHEGAQLRGEFSRLDYQARPHIGGVSALKTLVAKLPPRAHSVYYRDDIGNISTSHLWGDQKKTQLEIEPRYPLFGGWKTKFTIGYGLPLKDFLFQSEGKRFLNISFGSPINDLVIDKLVVKVILPEGSSDISVSIPFPVEQSRETLFSHLDMVGRPVVVLEKTNVVHEHNKNFQVYYKFSSFSLMREPLMLISGFFFMFVACIIYTHADLTISKTSTSYIARLQWDEVQTAIQQVQNIIKRCLAIHEKLETSLRDLSRTGDVQACKAARKAADGLLKEISKELKPLLAFIRTSSQATQILTKVEDLVSKERELQERLMLKHSTVVDCYEKKSAGRDMESRVAPIQQKITVLRQEVDDLIEVIDEI